MHPSYGHMSHFHRGPSRLVWFILGGVAASWYLKRKEMRSYEQYIGHCLRKPIQQAPPATPAPDMNQNISHPNPNHRPHWNGGWNESAEARYEVPSRQNSPPIALPFGWSNEEWEAEKQNMWSMGRQAGDTLSELSESTLENVLSTVETLKVKLAEHRAEREQQRKLFEQQMEERKKEPRHYV